MTGCDRQVVALHSGSAAETRTFAAYRQRLADVVDTRHGPALPDADVVWVPEGTPRRRLAALTPALEAVLDRGGVVLLFGDHQASWPAHARWTFRPAGGAGQTTIGAAWRDTEVGAAAAALHHHGVLTPPTGAEILLAAPDGAAVAYLDRTSTAGTMLISTIDPLAHFGHTGAPNAAEFLDELLLWVTTALPRRRDGS
ncbi:MAG: hypothetical protein M3228_09630 [Actinomycetota bacterium]|nr:hypothetical protein [Actinomycetota bacterium]